MFELREKPATLVKFNPRAENHGADVKAAGDLKFKLNLQQHTLDALHPSLRAMYFTKYGTRDDVDADLADQSHEAPNLRASAKLLGPHKWGAKFVGYELRIHLGTSERSHVVINDCDLNQIAFDPQEGGTVVFAFRLQFHPDEKTAGKLCMLEKTNVDISLLAPEGAREVEPGEGEGSGDGDE